jgi:pimeloyl-ACP methyl ester carboxylesterase
MRHSTAVCDTTLFLHGGPGLCCQAERTLYETSLPVHWWDQPRSVGLMARPYGDLLEFTIDELHRLATAAPVHIVAHSFGAVLALEAARRAPQCIRTLTLLAPVHDVGATFVQVADALMPSRSAAQRPAVEWARNRYLAQVGDADQLLALGRAIMANPDFLDVYWAPESRDRRDGFYALMREHTLFDLAVFEAVLRDFVLAAPRPPRPVASAFPVHVVLGRFDLAFDRRVELPYWASCFPSATFRTTSAGHMVQLECPPTTWLEAALGTLRQPQARRFP